MHDEWDRCTLPSEESNTLYACPHISPQKPSFSLPCPPADDRHSQIIPMACPQISLWSPAPSRCLSPMHSIDIATLSDRLQRLTPPSDIISDFVPSPDLFVPYSRGVAQKVMDAFAHELSPTSSMSSSDGSDSSSPEDAFFATRSRVVRVSGVRLQCCFVADALQLYNLPAMAEAFLSAVFLPHNVRISAILPPVEYNFKWLPYRQRRRAL